jgi:hypothetical protein
MSYDDRGPRRIAPGGKAVYGAPLGILEFTNVLHYIPELRRSSGESWLCARPPHQPRARYTQTPAESGYNSSPRARPSTTMPAEAGIHRNAQNSAVLVDSCLCRNGETRVSLLAGWNYTAALRRTPGMPVFDIYSLVPWFRAGLRPRRFDRATGETVAR